MKLIKYLRILFSNDCKYIYIIIFMSKSKILTIFDLSRTLLIAEKMGKQQYFDKRMELEKIKPNDKYE